ncbi:PPOX class F420-dependent oxidoreductase [Streptomyces fuscigenes]|uniref:PPOX class F420-dependent oxidoreductase n=1 Tax=Streptomyces fuscigenes TaxID=1528880 RepID=UPI001F2BAB94|nr:PPOX class F420-dependent oxidoreductase [Streptomyces fuscigenes]MCF3964718.1 PPOX class F420-dependent oxidoreductase [Streptomyces fuscigenes]
MTTPDRQTLDALARAPYVSLTTYRRDGVGVDTPVWHVVDDRTLYVWTDAGSWKVKRVRNVPRAVVTVCTVTGRMKPGAVRAEGAARLVPDAEGTAHIRGLLLGKYGLRFRVTELSAKLSRRRARHPITGIAVDL